MRMRLARSFLRGESGITFLLRKGTLLPAALRVALSRPMTLTPRALQWRNMAGDARAIADGMHDSDSKRTMLEIADSYDRLAVWAEETTAGGMEC
jgi:hypothetical protein